MKLRKRRISILLSMLLLLSVFQPAVALDVDPDFEQIYEIGTRLLGDIEHEKELYGLGGVNFDNLYIGEYIPAYIAKETGLTPSNIRYYPVLENGGWVATLSCYEVDGIWNGTLSNRFVTEVPEIDANDDLKLIFDSNTCYLSKNSVIHNLTSYNAVAERVNIASSPMTLSEEDGQKLVNKRAVEIDRFNVGAVSQRSMMVTSELPMNVYLDIIAVRQTAEWACPIACLQCIMHHFGYIFTEDALCSYHPEGIDTSVGASLTDLTYICAEIGMNFQHYLRNISFTEFRTNLANDRPMIMACSPTAESYRKAGHAVVARGYTAYSNSSVYAGSFAYVNTYNASYEVGTVSIGNVYHYSYTREDGTASYNAVDFLAVYE